MAVKVVVVVGAGNDGRGSKWKVYCTKRGDQSGGGNNTDTSAEDVRRTVALRQPKEWLAG